VKQRRRRITKTTARKHPKSAWKGTDRQVQTMLKKTG
jgi:hypothetical protein